MADLTINLTSGSSYTPWISAFDKFILAAQIQVPSGTTWASAVVGLEWSVTNNNLAVANTFSPVVSFTTTTKGRVNINIASIVWFRFKVTEAEGASGPATIVYQIE